MSANICKAPTGISQHGWFRIALISVATMAASLLLLFHPKLDRIRLMPIKEENLVQVTEKESLVQVTEKESLDATLLRYRPPPLANVTTIGKELSVNYSLQKSVGIPITEFINLTRSNVENFVFVTGASSNHLRESLDAVAGVQKFLPHHKIIYYDLGLTREQIDQVKSFCNVEYRKFNFSRYPKHMKKLTTYAFKPLIVQEVLLTYPGLFWMDASVRLLKNFSTIYPQVLDTGGFLQFWHSPHSNRAVTHPDQYAYFPTNTSRQEEVGSRAAGAVLIFRTRKVYWSIIHWWVMCALDKDCIAPKRASLGCNFHTYGNKKYAHCHRYDMSALNLLSSNLYGYNDKKYTANDQGVVKIVKHVTSLFTMQICQSQLQ